MKGAEFVGIDAVNENLETFTFDAIGVFHGKTEKFKVAKVDEDETEESLIEKLNNWFQRMLTSNPANNTVYGLQLYELPEDGKKLRGTSSFTFQLVEHYRANTPKETISGGAVTQRELELSLENQKLQHQLEMLSKRMDEMEAMEDDEEDEPEPVGAFGAIENAVIEKLPGLLDVLITQFTTKQQTMNTVTTVGNAEQTTEQILAEFKQINPQIESDLAKLLNVAKTNPSLFNMLITQLRSM